MLVSERIRLGLVKPGSIYARFAELTPYAMPVDEQRAVWQVRRGRLQPPREAHAAQPRLPRNLARSCCACTPAAAV